MKRILKFIGCLALCCVGLSALAAGNVAMVGETEYATIEDAWRAVAEGGTIKLIANAAVIEPIDNTLNNKTNPGRAFTIDLDGKTLTMNSGIRTDHSITFSKGNVVIGDPTGATIGENPWDKVFELVYNQRVAENTLLFDQVNFTCERADVPAVIQTGARQLTVRFNKSNFYVSNCQKPVYIGGNYVTVDFIDTKVVANKVSTLLIPSEGATCYVTLKGGSVEMTDCAGFANNCNSLTIDGCDVSATGLTAHFINACAMTLKNGAKVVLGDSPNETEVMRNSGFVVEAGSELKISGMPKSGLSLNKASSVADGADVAIDCPITAKSTLQIATGAYKSVAASGTSASIDLTGGFYKEEPADAFVNPAYQKKVNTDEPTLAAGYQWTIAPPPVAMIGDKEFKTYAEALEAATSAEMKIVDLMHNDLQGNHLEVYADQGNVYQWGTQNRVYWMAAPSAGVDSFTGGPASGAASLPTQASNAAAGSVLCLPEGTFDIASVVAISKSITLSGWQGGAGTTLRKPDHSKSNAHLLNCSFRAAADLETPGEVNIVGLKLASVGQHRCTDNNGSTWYECGRCAAVQAIGHVTVNVSDVDIQGFPMAAFSVNAANSINNSYAITGKNATLNWHGLTTHDNACTASIFALPRSDQGDVAAAAVTQAIFNYDDNCSFSDADPAHPFHLEDPPKRVPGHGNCIVNGYSLLEYQDCTDGTVKGGFYAADPTASGKLAPCYVANYKENYEFGGFVQNGWLVEQDTDACQAKIVHEDGSVTYYATFVDAVKAAANGGTVSVNREIEAVEEVVIENKDVTLDLAGQVINSGITFSGAGVDFIIDSVGGGKVLGEIKVLGENCTLKIRAGLYAFDPKAWRDPSEDEKGMPLYIVVTQDDGLFKVMENQVEPQETPATKTTVLDENGDEIPPGNVDEETQTALDEATAELAESTVKNSAYDGGVDNVAKNADGKPKASTVDNLRANAPAGTADQITSDSKVSSKFLIELDTKVATVKSVATAGGMVKKAVYTTLIYDVKPIVKTTVIKGDVETIVKAQLSNEEVKKNPVTFRLAIVDPMATGAYVRHIGHDEFADETRFCKVQGAAGERYVEVKDVDHFSLFEVRTTTAVVTETEDAVTILNLGVPAPGSELAAAVPFLKSGVTVDTPAKLADLVITGRANGDKIVFQNAGTFSELSGGEWINDGEQTVGTPFWYQSVGSGIPLTLAGFMPNSASTEIAPGSATAPVATLLVNPFNSAQDIFLALAGAQDGDQVALAGGNERYVRKGGVWGFYSKSANMTHENDVYVDNDFTPVSSLAVPGGKGVWYISKHESAPTVVAWSAAGAASEAEQIADADVPTYGSIAWGVSLDVERKAAFDPEFARLVIYNGDAEVGGYTRQLADGQLESAWTVFLSAGTLDWADVTQAKFAVRLLDGDRQKIVESEKVGYAALAAANLAVNYAGSVAPKTSTAKYTAWSFSVTDAGEFDSLKTTFEGAGVVTKTADGYKVTLTNDMAGVVTLAGQLGKVTFDLNGHTITGADGTLTNPVGAGGIAIEISGAEPGPNPTELTVMNGDPSAFAQIAGGKGASSATGFNGGAAIFVDPALAEAGVLVNVTGPNAQSGKPLVQGGNAGVGYVSTTGEAGPAITAANVGAVGEGMTAAGAAGELHKAWAWCTGTVSPIEATGFETDATGTNWFFHTENNGGASFDFKALSGKWTGDGVIHFVAGPIDVDGLKDTGYNGNLTFVGDPAGTTLRAISEASVFAVTGVTEKRTWKNLKFTDGASVAADKADGGAISMTGGSLSIEGCTFENCVGGEFGGAVYAALLTDDSTVTNSTFTGNAPLAEGDAYYNENALGGAIYVTAAEEDVTFAVADSVFEGNEAYSGGAIYAETKAADGEKPVALSILRVTFSGNRADGFDGNGGAIVAEGDVTVDEGNVTVDEVDGLVYAGEPTVFTNNTATSNGGAIEMTGSGNESDPPTVKICRGVVFADNKVVDGVDMVLGGAFANWIPCRFEAMGVEFRGNTATCASKSEGYGTSLALGGALAFTGDAKAVLVDTCVFNGNDVIVQEGNWRYGGAIGMVNIPSAILKNSTFRNSTAEALALLGSTVGITNCVIVGNGAGLGTAVGAPLDVWIEQSTVDIAYSAYGNVEDLEAGSLTWLEHGNLAGCVPDKVYAGETLRLNENGFNPVAALGITQDAFDFVGVRYGSKNVELGGSSMGAYETGFTPLVVTLTGDKTYDGHTTSNGCAWTWKLTDTNGVAQTWDELGDVSNAFSIVDWTFGRKDHGYYASTNAEPMNVDAHLAGNENLWFALRFRYDGTISRRDVELGGMLVETVPDEYAYSGSEIKADVKVTDTNANEVLVLGTDYILRYENNVNPTDGALAIVEGINNYEGVVSTNYFITAYYVEYSFDGVVDDSLTEIHGAKSADVVEALPYAETPEGYAFDKFHSPTNGAVYRYGDGTPAQLVLEVKYCTDANGDTVPDKYQKQIRAKVVNGEWNDENNGRDKILWVTLTEDGSQDGVWSTEGKGKLPTMPAAGANADGGYTGNKDNKWLTLKGSELVYLTAQQLEEFYVTSGSVPFFLYAYLKGNPGSSLGFGFGRPGSGSGSTGAPDVAGRFAAYVTASSLTMNPAKKLATISVKANLVEAESGAPVMDIPLEGSKVTVKAMETLGGPAEDLEVPVDGDGNVTVPAEGASGFWQVGL